MASFSVYDPKTKLFRAWETPSETDLTFDQVMLVNILIELRVITDLMAAGLPGADPADLPGDDPDELRAAMVQEIGS